MLNVWAECDNLKCLSQKSLETYWMSYVCLPIFISNQIRPPNFNGNPSAISTVISDSSKLSLGYRLSNKLWIPLPQYPLRPSIFYINKHLYNISSCFYQWLINKNDCFFNKVFFFNHRSGCHEILWGMRLKVTGKGQGCVAVWYLPPYLGYFILPPRRLVGVTPYPRKSQKELYKRKDSNR